jgi:hypothetical protein
MDWTLKTHSLRLLLLAALAVSLLLAPAAFATDMHTSKPFSGVKVNGGTVTHTKEGGKNVLTLSDDFQVPDTPDPHWQVVDSKGTVYPLQRLDIKGEGMDMKGDMKNVKTHRRIVLPSYIPDVAKVQIYCAWAEALLGEAPFEKPVK